MKNQDTSNTPTRKPADYSVVTSEEAERFLKSFPDGTPVKPEECAKALYEFLVRRSEFGRIQELEKANSQLTAFRDGVTIEYRKLEGFYRAACKEVARLSCAPSDKPWTAEEQEKAMSALGLPNSLPVISPEPALIKPLDDRDAMGGWAPGNYFCTCHFCACRFTGAKRSHVCADCAYGAAENTYPDLSALLRASRLIFEGCSRAGMDFDNDTAWAMFMHEKLQLGHALLREAIKSREIADAKVSQALRTGLDAIAYQHAHVRQTKAHAVELLNSLSAMPKSNPSAKTYILRSEEGDYLSRDAVDGPSSTDSLSEALTVSEEHVTLVRHIFGCDFKFELLPETPQCPAS